MSRALEVEFRRVVKDALRQKDLKRAHDAVETAFDRYDLDLSDMLPQS